MRSFGVTGRGSATRRVLCLASLLVALGTALDAQTVIGIWQGTLPAGESTRVVVKVAQADDGSLRGLLNFVDRGPVGAPLLSVTFAAPDLNFAVGDISYRGKLSADGKSIAGTWTEGNRSNPLTLVLATPATLWTYSGPAPLPAMAATADPAFEVATIKPSSPAAKGKRYGFSGRHFAAANSSVEDLVEVAYQVRDRQIDGGPSWMNEDKFDIAGEPDAPGQPSEAQQRVMLRKLLADRFGLRLQTVQRDFLVYALTVEKSPPKVTKSATSEPHGSVYVKDGTDGQTAVQFAYTSMQEFANTLMNFISDRPIVDETGLIGEYDFALMIPTNTAWGRQGPDEMDKPTAYFNAVIPLGLKLVPKKEPLPVVVIDHVDRPSAN